MLKDERGISRHDQSNNAKALGWQVRLQRRAASHTRFFADSKYGGAQESLAAARRYRDQLFAGAPEETTAERRDRLTRRNKSGVVGVSYSSRERQGQISAYWVAQWTGDDGSRRTISFSIEKYGEEEAFGLACIARELLSTDREEVEQQYTRRRARRHSLPRTPSAAILPA